MKPHFEPITEQEARLKVLRYCAYQERCISELAEKLRSYGLSEDVSKKIIDEMISERFVSETRYASAYARGKFRQRGWGRIRIRMELTQKGIEEADILAAFAEIPEDEYLQRLRSVLRRKAESLGGESLFDRNGKLAKFAIRRGFEPDLVWNTIRSQFGG